MAIFPAMVLTVLSLDRGTGFASLGTILLLIMVPEDPGSKSTLSNFLDLTRPMYCVHYCYGDRRET